VRLIVRDDVSDEYRSRFATPHGSRIEVVILSVGEFEQAREFGTESDWDRYSYVQAEVVVDKSGLVADLVAAKSQLQPEVARLIAAEHLDSYINSYYRAAKTNAASSKWRLVSTLLSRSPRC
jgi:hypothetical protein